MIAAVVVTHAPPAGVLERSLASLRASGDADHVIVVDTGGAATDVVSNGAASGAVEVLVVENRGYGAAANVGFARAAELGADAVALLNDDVIVRPGWLEPLVAALADPAVGVAQPKLLFADRVPPTINSLGVVIGPDGAGHDVAAGEPDRLVGDRRIEHFTGGAIVLSSAFVAATNGFDERYFLYYEDVDLAERGRALGFEYRLVGRSVVEHVGSASTSGTPDRTRFLQERNRLWCAFRHAPATTVVRAVWLSVRRLRHRPRRVHATALLAGLGGGLVRLAERAAQRLRNRR